MPECTVQIGMGEGNSHLRLRSLLLIVIMDQAIKLAPSNCVCGQTNPQ